MRQFFKHFGSKARLAALLPPPRYPVIIEPFAGSAAYSVQHATPKHDVLLFDTDERVCIVWDYLINASPADIMALPVEHFLKGGDIRELNLPRPEFLLIQRWLAMSGTHSHFLAPCLLKAENTGQCWGHAARLRISRQVTKIRHWKIDQAAYTSAPDITAHWHIDPPYEGNAHGLTEYKCEPLDYSLLAKWCESRRGDITVHEQDGASWLPFRTLLADHASARNPKGGEKVTAHEVIWTNDHRDRTGTMALFER